MNYLDDKSREVIMEYLNFFSLSLIICIFATSFENQSLMHKNFIWHAKWFSYILSGTVLCNITNFQTWGGKELHEKLNKYLFLSLSLMSIFLAVLAMNLENKNEIISLSSFLVDKTTIINLVIALISGLYAWYKNGMLAKNLEKYKSELQATFIKTELKTTQVFNIYPNLFALFKELEGELHKLRGPVPRKRQVTEDDIAQCRKDELSSALNYLAKNLLFLSREIRSIAIKTKDVMIECLFAETEEEGKKLFKESQKCIDELEEKMKKELDNQ